MNIFTKIRFPFLVLLLLCITTPVLAAEIHLDADKTEIHVGDEFSLNIIIHSQETVNAVEGRVVYPQDLLTVKEIRDGKSIINFWVEKPHVETSSGAIVFSGITPGGFSGTNNHIFSVVFEAKNIGNASITLENTKALLNDGLGTQTELSTRNTAIPIKPGDNNVRKENITDTEPPEDFTPTIASDPNIFDGKYFLVFEGQDKLSGIADYEVREGDWGWFNVAQSPYELKNQALDSKIFVKSIDKAGNERLAIVNAQKQPPWYQQYALLIMLPAVILLGFFTKKLWKKSTK